MDNNEEMIEEINDVEETVSDSNNSELNNQALSNVQNAEAPSYDSQQMQPNGDNVSESLTIEEQDTNQNEVIKKKSKAPALIILFILLILDIAAIVIYIIGIDKVLSFIK